MERERKDIVMTRKALWSGWLVMVSAVLTLATPPIDDQILQTGKYTARVTAIPCEGCPSVIEQTMLAQPGIASAKADQKTSTLTFTVKSDAVVKVSDLQKALKAASDQMGMGADYSLKDITKS
jgi:hypothetical protein